MDFRQPDIGALFALLTGPAALEPSEENFEVNDLGAESGGDEENSTGDEGDLDAAPRAVMAPNEVAPGPNADIPPLAGVRVVRPVFTTPPLLTDCSLDRELNLSDDPQEAIANNDYFRDGDAVDGPTSGLWTIDQLALALPKQYKYFPEMTLAPRHWPSAIPVRQEEYANRFKAEFPEVAAILPIENVYVAGGAAAWPLGESSVKVGDVDFFIAGIDPADRVALWKKVSEVVRKLRRAFVNSISNTTARHMIINAQVLSPGVVTIKVRVINYESRNYSKEAPRKFQIILRAFPSVSRILYGFDVPACSVAYDGCRTYLTYLAAFTHAFRVIIVWPSYSSPTYSSRIIKYFNRGFALALPHLQRGTLVKNVPLKLPDLVLLPTVVRGRFAVGTVALPDGMSAADSDYGSDCMNDISWTGDPAVWAPGQVNLRQLMGSRRFTVMSLTKDEYRQGRRSRRVLDLNNKGLPFAKFATKEPEFSDILPRALFNQVLDISAAATVPRQRGLVNIKTLRTVFRMSDSEISRFTVAVSEASSRNPSHRLDMSPALAKFRAAVEATYEATPAHIGWWIVTNPSRQGTVSLNPTPKSPADWYGPAYAAEVRHPTSEELIEALLATLEGRQGVDDNRPVFDGMCPLCREPLARGVANSIILPCGHIYHWGETEEGCVGFYSWSVNHQNCPTCRRTFSKETRTAAPREPAAIPVNIEW